MESHLHCLLPSVALATQRTWSTEEALYTARKEPGLSPSAAPQHQVLTTVQRLPRQ